MNIEAATSAVARLWAEQDPGARGVTLEPCPVSGNNRVFVARRSDGGKVVAKFYYAGQAGETDRLRAEWDFLAHAYPACPRSLPCPLAQAGQQRLALYEFIDGVKFGPDQVGAAHVDAAAGLIAAINAAPVAGELPPAREACFSLAEHFAVIDRRLDRLNTIALEDAAAVVLAGEMRHYWAERRAAIEAGASALGICFDQPIPQDQRVLSPSDFGFHNALLRPDGEVVFIDFEYAGWDDVAKLASDFFFQPAVPVDRSHYQRFVAPIVRSMANGAAVRRRIDLLRPIFGLKWCCIMLNHFLPDMAVKARFADPDHDEVRRKSEQLSKARKAFQQLVIDSWPISIS
jgi:hypothetical protein